MGLDQGRGTEQRLESHRRTRPRAAGALPRRVPPAANTAGGSAGAEIAPDRKPDSGHIDFPSPVPFKPGQVEGVKR
jgi:hypothetical protein